jgi:hypothetical protein
MPLQHSLGRDCYSADYLNIPWDHCIPYHVVLDITELDITEKIGTFYDSSRTSLELQWDQNQFCGTLWPRREIIATLQILICDHPMSNFNEVFQIIPWDMLNFLIYA